MSSLHFPINILYNLVYRITNKASKLQSETDPTISDNDICQLFSTWSCHRKNGPVGHRVWCCPSHRTTNPMAGMVFPCWPCCLLIVLFNRATRTHLHLQHPTGFLYWRSQPVAQAARFEPGIDPYGAHLLRRGPWPGIHGPGDGGEISRATRKNKKDKFFMGHMCFSLFFLFLSFPCSMFFSPCPLVADRNPSFRTEGLWPWICPVKN